MSVLLVLNELSCSTESSRVAVDEAMIEFVELLRTARRLRSDIALITPVRIDSIELAMGYSVQQWISSNAANRDRWRFVRAVQNRAPFRAVLPKGENEDGEAEYRCGELAAHGLGVAHVIDGLAVSLPIGAMWDHRWVTVHRSTLLEERGDLTVRHERVNVRHAATRDHLSSHDTWIRGFGLSGLESGSKIWASTDRVFPHLGFLPRVEGDLQRLGRDCVQSVVNALFNLELAVAEWSPAKAPTPDWRTKVTGESASRQKYCEFVDLDGVVRVFELHARFTPGHGRIHFRLLPENGTARVAYVGGKLGV